MDCISNNNVFCVHVQQVMIVTTEEVQTFFVEENSLCEVQVYSERETSNGKQLS